MNGEIHGGRGGVTARLDDLLALSAAHLALAGAHRRAADSLRRTALDDALARTAPLAPASAARAAAALARALRSLVAGGLQAEELALALRAAVAGYRATDDGLRALIGAAETGAGLALTVAGAGLAVPVAVDVLVAAAVTGRAPGSVLDSVLAHAAPEVEVVAGGASGVWTGLRGVLTAAPALVPGAVVLPGFPLWSARSALGGPKTYAEAVDRLGRALPERSVRVAPWDVAAVPAATTPGALLRRLDVLGSDPRVVTAAGPGRRAADPPRRDGSGPGLALTRVTAADGVERCIVELPGTARWSLWPGTEPRDLTADIHLSAATRTAYADAVLLALAGSGVPPGTPLLLVGHSQGGMVAAALLADPRMAARYRVSAVLVAGAPVGRSAALTAEGRHTGHIGHQPQERAPVLALENTADLVPRLDGLPNPDRPWVTTARFSHQTGSVAPNHSLAVYAAAADSLPRDDPSVAAWSAAVAPFLQPATGLRTRWSMRRVRVDAPP